MQRLAQVFRLSSSVSLVLTHSSSLLVLATRPRSSSQLFSLVLARHSSSLILAAHPRLSSPLVLARPRPPRSSSVVVAARPRSSSSLVLARPRRSSSLTHPRSLVLSRSSSFAHPLSLVLARSSSLARPLSLVLKLVHAMWPLAHALLPHDLGVPCCAKQSGPPKIRSWPSNGVTVVLVCVWTLCAWRKSPICFCYLIFVFAVVFCDESICAF
jgi:hypothetical protein